jgi:hypothetical protein
MKRWPIALALLCAAPASAQSMSVVCDHTAPRARLPAEAFNIDLAGKTVQGRHATVPASVTDQIVEWQSGQTLYTLDRRNNMLIRVVLGEYATAWRCR